MRYKNLCTHKADMGGTIADNKDNNTINSDLGQTRLLDNNRMA